MYWADCTSSFRSRRSPVLVMESFLSMAPDWSWRGTRPSEGAQTRASTRRPVLVEQPAPPGYANPMPPAAPPIPIRLRLWNTDQTWLTTAPPTPVLPGLPDLAALRAAAEELTGSAVWLLSFHRSDPIEARFCRADQHIGDTSRKTPWSAPAWRRDVARWISGAIGPHTLEQRRVWGRSTVLRVETPAGEELWFKESYGLPPGEGVALALAARSGLAVPEVVAAGGHRALMRPLGGLPLGDTSPEIWGQAMAELVRFQREADPAEWVAAGCRDLREVDWHAQIRGLLAAYALPMDAAGALAARFEALWDLPATVLPWDLGPCNLRWLGDRVQAFDWSDVVVGPPAMLLDRWFNECPEGSPERAAVTAAWLEAWAGLGEEAWRVTRRCALLLEVLRYHSELAWLDADSPLAARLRRMNAQQLRRQLDAL